MRPCSGTHHAHEVRRAKPTFLCRRNPQSPFCNLVADSDESRPRLLPTLLTITTLSDYHDREQRHGSRVDCFRACRCIRDSDMSRRSLQALLNLFPYALFNSGKRRRALKGRKKAGLKRLRPSCTLRGSAKGAQLDMMG